MRKFGDAKGCQTAAVLKGQRVLERLAEIVEDPDFDFLGHHQWFDSKNTIMRYVPRCGTQTKKAGPPEGGRYIDEEQAVTIFPS